MKVAIVQMDIIQGNFDANLEKVERLAGKAKAMGASIAVFPEMFLCGFNYKKNLEYLRENGDFAERQLCKIAKKFSIAICGSVPHLLKEDMPPVNRFLLCTEDGEILSHYDKIHLFRVFNEDNYITPGGSIVSADTDFGRVGFAICYDLRFPEMFVEMTKRNVKLVIVSAAFPHPRSEHWRILCRARAIENQCFILAVNRSGVEDLPSGPIKYFGLSAVIDPWGGVVCECGEDASDDIAVADINLDEVDFIRAKIPALADRREDLY